MEKIEFTFTRILSQSDSGWTVSLASQVGGKLGAKSTKVVGVMPQVSVDDTCEVHGEWINHPKFGRQFKAEQVIPKLAGGDRGLVVFLRSLPNVGEHRAREILSTFGGRDPVLDILENDPVKLTAVAGITEERAGEIAEAFLSRQGMADGLVFLTGDLGVGHRLAGRILENLGNWTRRLIEEDPYTLMRVYGIGFVKADEIAQREPLAMPADDPRRLRAATVLALDHLENDGHCFGTTEQLASKRFLKDTGVTIEQLGFGLQLATQASTDARGQITPPIVSKDGDVWWRAATESKERELAQVVLAFLQPKHKETT
jgi:exodeoxyribonuclease V alpha subunit